MSEFVNSFEMIGHFFKTDSFWFVIVDHPESYGSIFFRYFLHHFLSHRLELGEY